MRSNGSRVAVAGSGGASSVAKVLPDPGFGQHFRAGSTGTFRPPEIAVTPPWPTVRDRWPAAASARPHTRLTGAGEPGVASCSVSLAGAAAGFLDGALVLDDAVWRARAAAHEARVDALVGDHLARRGAGVKHPVHDFLFTYYSFRPAQLRRWSPGSVVSTPGALGPATRRS